MFYNIKLSHYSFLPKISNLVYYDGAFVLPAEAEEGEIMSPSISPKLVYQWDGLNIEGSSEEDVEISLVSPVDQNIYYAFNNGSFEAVRSPCFCNIATIRLWLPYWKGDIRLLFRLTRKNHEVLPYIVGYTLGCNSLGDALTYLIDFGIPLFLKRSYEFQYQSSTDSNGAVRCPMGFNPNSIFLGAPGLNAPAVYPSFITLPEKKILKGTTVTGGSLISFFPLTPNKTGYLVFNYPISIFPISGNGVFQVTEVPCIALRYIEDQNTRYVDAHEYIQSASLVKDKAVYKQTNLRFELKIIAQNIKDVRTLGSQIIDLFCRERHLYLPAYDRNIPVYLLGTLKENSGSINTIITESLASGTIDFEVINWEK